MKKNVKIISIEKCDIETDDINNNTKIIFKIKTLIRKIENCKPFIGISILFLLITLILDGIIIYLLKAKS